jgi:molybdenum cofactor biosynthesis protein B
MVITVSDTRTIETDKSGALMKQLLTEKGHVLQRYSITEDDYQDIRRLLQEADSDPTIDVVLLNGGTGISTRDTTFEAVKSELVKELPGFGEIFRFLSYTEDIGTAAILSRAIAGVMKCTAVFSTPGSTGAVKLAMERIILPELGHVIREIRKDIY